MRKQNLAEEIYRMRKLMNFDSKEFNENTTSLDRLIEEKLRLNLLTEQETDNEEPPKFHDWTKGGKFNWESAKIKDIIKYINEVDASIDPGILDKPSYTTMMDWFSANDSNDSRDSLKNWMFGNIYYGIDIPDKVKQTKKNVKPEDDFDEELQKNLPTELSSFNVDDVLTKITDPEEKKKIDNIKTSNILIKLKKQIDAFNTANVLIPKEDLIPLSDSLNYLKSYTSTSDDNENGDLDGNISVLTDFEKKTQEKKGKGMSFDIDDSKIDVDINESVNLKRSLLNKLQKEIEEVGIDKYKKLLSKIHTIEITDEPQQLNSFMVETKKGPIIKTSESDSVIINYPLSKDSQEERNNLGNNFFEDDGTSLNNTTIKNIEIQIGKLINLVNEKRNEVEQTRKDNNLTKEQFDLKILSFNVFTYSSTSKVRTSYKSKDKTFSESNNIKLAEDRCDIIYNFIKGRIEGNPTLKKMAEDVIYASKAIKPNVGPGWQKLDGKDVLGNDVPLSQYGKLFQEAYKRQKDLGKELTPRFFYGSRTQEWANKASKLLGRKISQQELAMEYESTYGPYRMNLAGISVSMVLPELLKSEEIDQDYFVIGVPGLALEFGSDGTFDITQTWDSIKRGGKKFVKKVKKILRGLKPRGPLPKMPVFKGRTTDCPKW